MKEFGRKLGRNMPLLLLVIVELCIGVMLFFNPENITKIAILVFGGILTLIGVIHLIRYLWLKKEGFDDIFALILAIISLLFGLILLIFPNAMVTLVKGVLGVVFVLYGIGMIISGVYKIALFIDLHKVGVPVTILTLFAGILSILLGVVILVNVKAAEEIMWRVAGISLLIEGILDAISLVANVAKQ